MFESLEVLIAQLRAGAPPAPDLDDGDWPPVLDPDGSVVDRIVELERTKAMIEARVMVLTAELADRADGWVDPRDVGTEDELSGAILAGAELAPALHLAPVTAGIRVERALRLRDRLPGTLAALGHGRLDLGRVLAIDEATRPLNTADATRVERMVLPKAVDQTAGELRAALRRAVIAVDPDGAEARRQVAIKGRRVTRYERDDGTSVVEAVLSAIDTGEIYDVVDEMARRTKTTKDTRSMDARRADALVRLVLGRDPHLGPEDPEPPTDDDVPPDPPPPDEPHDDQPTVGEPSNDEPARDVPDDDEPGQEVPDDEVPNDQPGDEMPHDGPGEDWPGREQRQDDTSGRDQSGGDQSRDPEDWPAEHSDPDEAGWSQWPDAAEVALRDAELTRIDLARADRISDLATLALSAMTVRRTGRPRWVSINTIRRPDGTTVAVGELEGYGPITSREAEHLLATGLARPPDPPSGRQPTPAQADRHDPPEWLDAETRVRDGTCRHPGCRVSARRGDLDHTIPHPRGKTVPGNLGGLCRRHHRVKHSGTWRVSQDGTGTYTWTSTITGRAYLTHPRGTTGNWTGTTTAERTVA